MGLWWNSGKYTRQQDFDYYMTQQYKLKLNIKTDADVIEWLEKQKADPESSIQGAVKKLIREEIEKENRTNPHR